MGNVQKWAVGVLLALPLSSLKGCLDGGREVTAFASRRMGVVLLGNFLQKSGD